MGGQASGRHPTSDGNDGLSESLRSGCRRARSLRPERMIRESQGVWCQPTFCQTMPGHPYLVFACNCIAMRSYVVASIYSQNTTTTRHNDPSRRLTTAMTRDDHDFDYLIGFVIAGSSAYRQSSVHGWLGVSPRSQCMARGVSPLCAVVVVWWQ